MEKPLNKMYDSIKTAQSPQFFSQLTGGSNVNTSSGWTRRLVKPWGLLLSLTGKGEMELDGESLKIPEGSLLVYKPGYRYTFRALGEWHYIWFHYPIRNHMIGEMDFNEVLPGLGMQVLKARNCRGFKRNCRKPPCWSRFTVPDGNCLPCCWWKPLCSVSSSGNRTRSVFRVTESNMLFSC